MEFSSFLSGIFILISFVVRDLYINPKLIAQSLPPPPAELDLKAEMEVDPNLLDDLVDPDPIQRRIPVVKEDDDFFDDEDEDNSLKSSMKNPSPLGPGSRISSAKFIGPTVRFLYCTTSGYKNAFEQFETIIQDKHPELSVEGLTFPPTNMRKLGAQFINVFKFLVIGSIAASQFSLLHVFGIPVGVTNWMSQNKMYAGLLCFFLCNFAETQLVATGAFEIFMDDVPLWSKLETGRVPSPPELMQIIDNQLKMGGREPVMEGFKLS